MISDKLAAQRNILAAERTLLAYIRTALGFEAMGISLLHFLKESLFFQILGWVLLPLGVLSVAIGVWRYRQTRRLIPDMFRKEQKKGRRKKSSS